MKLEVVRNYIFSKKRLHYIGRRPPDQKFICVNGAWTFIENDGGSRGLAYGNENKASIQALVVPTLITFCQQAFLILQLYDIILGESNSSNLQN